MQKAVDTFANLFAASQRTPAAVMADNFEQDPENAISRLLADLLYEEDWNYNDYPDNVNYMAYDSRSDQIVLVDGTDYDVVKETGIKLPEDRLESEKGARQYKALSIDNAENVKLIAEIQRDLDDKILITSQAYEKSFGYRLCREIEFVQGDPEPNSP